MHPALAVFEYPEPPLLPNEPRVPNLSLQQILTARFLEPARADLEALFLRMRAELDPIWSRTRPTKLGKPYPAGQCLEISLAMLLHLRMLKGHTLTGAPARGYAALSGFIGQGGVMRQVWGDLRGEYFQNAYLAGTLYIDVANDTVVRTKPPVEILPLEQANFRPILDFLHYARIANRYWGALAFPNHVLPGLAPHCPLVLAIPGGGGVQLHSAGRYMMALAQAGGFAASTAVLEKAPMPDGLFGLIRDHLSGAGLDLPASPELGRAQALKACLDARRERSEGRSARMLEASLATNRLLAGLRVDPA